MWKTVYVSFYGSSALLLISKIRQWYRLSVSPQALGKFWRSKITLSDQGWLPFPGKVPCNDHSFNEIQCPDFTVTTLAPRSLAQTEALESGSDQVFSLVGFLFLGDCWKRSQVIYLASFPGWFVWVCVRMWLGRKYSIYCFMVEKQRKTSLKEQCKVEYIFLLTPSKLLTDQTSVVLNSLPSKFKAKLCSCIQDFSSLSSPLHLQRKENLCSV